MGAILLNKAVSEGLNKGGFWKHGHTYQVGSQLLLHALIVLSLCVKQNPLACATSLAVQKAIVDENLLENTRTQGAHLGFSLSFLILWMMC